MIDVQLNFVRDIKQETPSSPYFVMYACFDNSYHDKDSNYSENVNCIFFTLHGRPY